MKISGKTVLLFVAGLGAVVTAYLAAKNTPEAQKRKQFALDKKREETGDETVELTKLESFQAQAGAYIPAITSAVVTIGSIIGSDLINKDNLKKAENALNEYKDMTKKLEGPTAAKHIEKAVEQKKNDEKEGKPWTVKQQFRITFQGRSIQFESTRYDVMAAIYELNRRFHDRGVVVFNEFLEYLGQKDKACPDGDDRGWEVYIGETIYGYTWIDIGLKECPDEPWVTEIYMPVYPHLLDDELASEELLEEGGKYSSGDMFMKSLGEHAQ